MKHDVLVFSQYPFSVGDKIRIEDGRCRGDWEVAAIEEHKVVLRCPISKKEFSWNKFCYLSAQKEGVDWPQVD
ncbi:MAG: hypothetical protein ACI8ZB_001192 [Desulforhopalus sp.]|jgi:hypothetical protein